MEALRLKQEPTSVSKKASKYASRLFNLSDILLNDLDFSAFSVLDDKTETELLQSKEFIKIMIDEAKKVIKQIDKAQKL